jgi:predicted esterase
MQTHTQTNTNTNTNKHKHKQTQNTHTFIIHSREDELIPYTHAEVLKKYANNLLECRGKHSSPKMNETFFKKIVDSAKEQSN